MRFAISKSVCMHICRFEGRVVIIVGSSVSICNVLIIGQICFIAIPRNAARKKFMTSALVIPEPTPLNSA